MRKLYSLLWVILCVIAIFITPASLFALQDPAQTPPPGQKFIHNDDQIVLGDDFVLVSGEQIKGDLTVFGGNVILEEGSDVLGDVNVFGGNVDVRGKIGGDINVIGGNVHLFASARVGGKQNVVGGIVTRDRGSVIGGATTSTTTTEGSKPSGFVASFPQSLGNWVSGVISNLPPQVTEAIRSGRWRVITDNGVLHQLRNTLSSAIFMTVLAILALAIFPNNYSRMSGIIDTYWVSAGGVGFLTWLAVPVLCVLMAITICLIPLALITALVWASGAVMGWALSATIFGKWLLKGFGKTNEQPIVITAIGSFVLAFVGALPTLGWFIGLVASSLGLGAIILTRFGTQPYPRLPLLSIDR
jgi:cytoskeletal protein CcmA (bactofilin family)